MDSVLTVVGIVGGLLTVVVGVPSLIAKLGNRAIKDERASFLEKQRDDYKEALEAERLECKRQLADQDQRIARLEGLLEAATGNLMRELGEKIGDRIGVAILSRIREGGGIG